MKPNPLAPLDFPSDWPEFGRLGPGGAKIDLKKAFATMGYYALAMLVVDVPGKGEICPWGSDGWKQDFELSADPDNDALLPREELEASGVTDATLIAWAKDKGIDLSCLDGADDPDRQAIRCDAFQRYIAEHMGKG